MIVHNDDDDDEDLPIARRSLLDRRSLTGVNQIWSNVELSPSARRLPRVSLNSSIGTDSGIDEHLPTPTQLLALYEKTIELAAKNKINISNAFQIPLVERLPEVLNAIAFDERSHASRQHEPNFIRVASIIDTSAKIYGLRVDALHHDTQQLSGSIQPAEESSPPKTTKKSSRVKANSHVAADLTTISQTRDLDFHPLQPPNMCHWPGGVGSESVYADMVSYTMYSSSDFALIKGFVDLNSRMNTEYTDDDSVLDGATKYMCDLVPLREVIKESEGENHVLGGRALREFTFNEEPTVSYIETIDECSIVDDSVDDNDDDPNILSDLRDEPTSFHFHELQSTYTVPMTMPSMDMTLLNSKMSFVDHVPYLLREKTDPSDYSYFDPTKLKLFVGPYVWKYTNLLHDPIKPSQPNRQANSPRYSSGKATRNFRVNLFQQNEHRSLKQLMSVSASSKAIVKNRKQTVLKSIPKQIHQLRLTRPARPRIELMRSNNIPDLIFDDTARMSEDSHVDDPVYEENDPPPYQDEPMEYDFIRPIHYDRIECDRNLCKVDTKKLQHQLADEYGTECSKTSSSPVPLSTLCASLIERNILSLAKHELISAFCCMLNHCNRKSLYMTNNSQQDDVLIQPEAFARSTPLSYAQTFI